LQDLLIKSSSEGGQTAKFDLADQLKSGLFRVDVVSLDLGIEESDLDSIVVEQGTSECDLTQDLLKILDPLSVLLERHGSGVIHQDDNIEKTDLDQVCGELDGQLPS